MSDDHNREENLNRGDPSGSCLAFREDLSAWIDGELEAGRVAALRNHLAICAACRRVRDGFTEMDAVLRSLPQPVLSENFQERLRERIHGELGETPAVSSPQVVVLSRAHRTRRVAQLAALAAGLAGLALFAAHYQGGGSVNDTTGLAVVEPAETGASEEPGDDELLFSIEGDAIEDLEFLEALDVLEKMAQDEQNPGATGGQTS